METVVLKSDNTKLVATNMLMAVVSDEDTCVGFALAGIGEYRGGQTNFLVVDDRNINLPQLEMDFAKLLKRPDIAIIVIAESIAAKIEMLIRSHTSMFPVLVEVPDRHVASGLESYVGKTVEKDIDEDELKLIQAKKIKSLNIFVGSQTKNLNTAFGAESSKKN